MPIHRIQALEEEGGGGDDRLAFGFDQVATELLKCRHPIGSWL